MIPVVRLAGNPIVPRLGERARTSAREYRSVGGFTDLVHLNGGDYQRFTGPKGDACVAIRKLGDRRAAGYRWLLDAGKCVAPGGMLPDRDIEAFLEVAQFRG